MTRTVEAEGKAEVSTSLWSYNLDSSVAMFRDAAGWIEEYFYNPDGEQIGEEDVGDGSNEYDQVNLAGETVKSADENGFFTTFARNALGIVNAVTDALNYTTTTTLDAAMQATAQTDEEGKTSYTSYNAAGQIETTTDKNNKTTTYTYNVFGQQDTIIDPRGLITKYEYDSSHRLTTLTYAQGTSDERVEVTTFYNETDQVHTQSDGINTTEYTYDSWGNTLTIKDALNQITTMGYDSKGRNITTTDATNKTTTYAYDALNRVKSVTDSNGKTSSSLFDGLGRVIQSTDARSNATRFAFDDDGHQWLTANPDGGQTWK